MVTVKARLAGLDPRLEQAAADLYANEWQTFWRVSFPLVFPGILAAALLSFSLSFDDFIITNLNAGQEVTFPMFVWGANQRGIPPQINVIGTMMFVIAVLVVVVGEVGNAGGAQAAEVASLGWRGLWPGTCIGRAPVLSYSTSSRLPPSARGLILIRPVPPPP